MLPSPPPPPPPHTGSPQPQEPPKLRELPKLRKAQFLEPQNIANIWLTGPFRDPSQNKSMIIHQ